MNSVTHFDFSTSTDIQTPTDIHNLRVSQGRTVVNAWKFRF